MIAVECCFLSIEKSKELKLETSFGLNSGGGRIGYPNNVEEVSKLL